MIRKDASSFLRWVIEIVWLVCLYQIIDKLDIVYLSIAMTLRPFLAAIWIPLCKCTVNNQGILYLEKIWSHTYVLGHPQHRGWLNSFPGEFWSL